MTDQCCLRPSNLRQLDELLLPLPASALPAPPRQGWLKALREALGITTRQFARRVGLANSAVVEAEQGEAAGTISIGQLRRLAEALDCDLRYLLVPAFRSSGSRARPNARRENASPPLRTRWRWKRSGAGAEFEEQQIAAAKDELLRGRRSRLWD